MSGNLDAYNDFLHRLATPTSRRNGNIARLDGVIAPQWYHRIATVSSRHAVVCDRQVIHSTYFFFAAAEDRPSHGYTILTG